jgi:hypothetical protein
MLNVAMTRRLKAILAARILVQPLGWAVASNLTSLGREDRIYLWRGSQLRVLVISCTIVNTIFIAIVLTLDIQEQVRK